MNKNEVFAHFSSILDNMIDNSSYFCTYFQNPCAVDDIEGSVDDEAMPENLRLLFGATRGCIVDDFYNYVVKFDIEGDAIGLACEREEEIYEHAQQEHLESFFAQPTYLGEYVKTIYFYDFFNIEQRWDWYNYIENYEDEFMAHQDDFGNPHEIVISIPLYCYPRASRYSLPCLTDTQQATYREIAYKIDSPMRERNFAIAINFVYEYGEEMYRELTDFMWKEDINDLHFGNIGEIDGHLILIDYAGYHTGATITPSYRYS